MTCIVGIINKDGTVTMGGDSAGVAGYSIVDRTDKKVFVNRDMVFGFTSSFRMGQLLQFQLKIPDHDPRVEDYKYMCTAFIEAVRSCLKSYGYNKTNNDVESGGTFLVGYKGTIYEIENDYQVGVRTGEFNSVGCGFELALGAMYTAASINEEIDGEPLAELGLEAAAKYSAGVCPPFNYVVTKIKE